MTGVNGSRRLTPRGVTDTTSGVGKNSIVWRKDRCKVHVESYKGHPQVTRKTNEGLST